MNIENTNETHNAMISVFIKNGRLAIEVDLPLKWTLITIGAIATTLGSPAITETIIKLLEMR